MMPLPLVVSGVLLGGRLYAILTKVSNTVAEPRTIGAITASACLEGGEEEEEEGLGGYNTLTASSKTNQAKNQGTAFNYPTKTTWLSRSQRPTG